MDAPLPKKQLVAYVASQELAKVSSLLPSNKRRSMIVHSLISSLGLLDPNYSETRRIQVVNPRRATYKELAVYHSRDYLDFVLDPKNSESKTDAHTTVNTEFGLEDDCPVFPGLSDYVQLVAGATLTAVEVLRQDIADIAINWDGGRHHAQKSHASGFCYVADCILAIMALKRPVPKSLYPSPARKTRVMYLDLDLHFSDAVSEAFYSPNASGDPQILTLSIHHTSPGFFPATPRSNLPSVLDPKFDPFTLSIPLRQGASNTTYMKIWPVVERVKDSFNPDYIVVQCGTDALAGDPCATFNWSLEECEGSLGWCIQRILDHWRGKKLLLGGGGYHSANASRAWAYLTSIALDQPLSLESEIPDHTGFPLYGPSFTLDIPTGTMRDHNTDEYIQSIHHSYEEIVIEIEKKLNI